MISWEDENVTNALEDVAKLWGLTYKDIVGKCRDYNTTMARMAIASLLVKICGYTTTMTGRLVGRDHSTVTYYCKTIPYEMLHNKRYAEKVKSATQIISEMFKRSKYKNTKVRVDGMVFDSKKEYQRWLFLKEKEKEGKIENLERQCPVELIPDIYEDVEVAMKTKTKVVKKKVQRAINYFCDFRYTRVLDGVVVYEDVKASPSSASLDDCFLLKEKLFRYVMGFSLTRVYSPTKDI